MKKLSLQFFLPLFIILLSGSNTLFAETYEGCIPCTSFKLLQEADDNYFGDILCSDDLDIKSAAFDYNDYQKEEIKIDLTDSEVEEENLYASVKDYHVDNFTVAGFYTLSAAYNLNYTNKYLSHSWHLFYAPSLRRYLMFRVFRIWFYRKVL